MANETINIGLRKPVPTENFDIDRDFNANWDKIDGEFGNLEADVSDITQQLEDGTAGIDDSVTSDSKVWSSSKVQQEIGNILNTPSTVYVSDIQPPYPSEGDLWFKIIASVPEIPVADYLYRFDASELQLNDGAKVAQWDDVSDNGHDITQTNANLQPVYLAEGFNGKPTVKFDGSILSKTSFNLDNVTENTMFLVMSVDVAGTSMGLIMGVTKSGLIAYGFRYSGTGRIELRILGTPLSSDPVVKNENAIFATTFNNSTVNSWKNGIFSKTDTTTMRIGEHDALQLGYSDCKVRISEAIQYSRILSNDEIDSVNAYLRQKWGI